MGETHGWEGIKPQTGPEGAEPRWTTPCGVDQPIRGTPTVGLRPRLLTVYRFAA